MKVKIISPQPIKPQLTTLDMEEGDVGVLREHYSGNHILRTYDNLVMLEDPRITWSIGLNDPKFQLDSILEKGTVLELTL